MSNTVLMQQGAEALFWYRSHNSNWECRPRRYREWQNENRGIGMYFVGVLPTGPKPVARLVL
jgi:hypothetical protein